ncbi:hypothetical protein AVEN_258966-1 [Araneus ventricosus]|uniref:Uncharacterized protein n=1 Tax=Araneus ventricosus TaxID=182803 RepID=A0A4Y2CEA5_ARAVE|nr:hypothetical protein AVEN_258966-1 [Araneus ventricosus]
MYHPSNGLPRTANKRGYFAVHEKQQANKAATASHRELPRRKETAETQGEKKLERRPDTRVPRGREARHTWIRCALRGKKLESSDGFSLKSCRTSSS